MEADGGVDTGLYTWNNDVPAPELLGIWNQTRAKVETLSAVVDAYASNVIGVANVDLTIEDPAAVDDSGRPLRLVRMAETNLGDLCADAFRDQMGVEVGFVNGGSVRRSIPKGEITMSDIMGTFPFGNHISVVEVTGRQLLDALEYASSAVPGENGAFLQTSGLTYEIHTYIQSSVTRDDNGLYSGVEGEYRVKNVRVNGEPLDLDRTYTMATLSYTALDNGDGMTAFDGAELIGESEKLDYELLADYIANSLGGVVGEGYENPYGQERIIAVEEPAEASGEAAEEPAEEPAAGMSFFDNPEINALIDAIKAELPEYKESHGAGADAVHFEGIAIYLRVIDAFLNGDMKGVNIVLSNVGANLDNTIQQSILPFEAAGYNVKVRFCPAKDNEAAARVVMRELAGGQLINSAAAFNFGDGPENVYNALKDMINANGEPYGYEEDEALEPAA